MRLNDCLRVLGDCLGVYHAATFEKAPPAEASGEVEEGDNVAQVPRCASVFMPSPVMRSYRQPWPCSVALEWAGGFRLCGLACGGLGAKWFAVYGREYAGLETAHPIRPQWRGVLRWLGKSCCVTRGKVSLTFTILARGCTTVGNGRETISHKHSDLHLSLRPNTATTPQPLDKFRIVN